VLLLVVSETGLVYTFTTPKLQPLVTNTEGKNLIQSCLNSPDDPKPEDCESEPGNNEENVSEPESDRQSHSYQSNNVNKKSKVSSNPIRS